MPSTLYQPSAQLIGVNTQEFVNQAQMMLKAHLKLPFTFATADAGVLFTVPTLTNGAAAIKLDSLFWEITTSMTGGATPAIGVSSSNAKYSTKGDLLGGASGDLTASLVSTNTYVPGTLGAKFAAAATTGKVFLVAGDTLRFDRIASAFTAGAGYVHVDITFID